MANISQLTDPLVVKRDIPNGVTVNGDDFRFGLGGLAQASPDDQFGFASGVFPSVSLNGTITDLQLTPNSPSPSMQTILNFGGYSCARSYHGIYLGAGTSPIPVTHTTANATNPRHDLVVVRVRDGDYDASVTRSADIVVIPGTPSANPADPTGSLTDGDFVVAAVTVRAGATTILATDIADRRVFNVARGGIYPKSAVDSRGGAYEGQYRDNTATKGLERWSDVSGWQVVANPAVWSNVTPVLYNGGDGMTPGTVVSALGNGSSAYCRYQVTGKKLELNYVFNWGTSGFNMGTGTINTLLPPGILHRNFNGESHIFAKLYIYDTVSGVVTNYLGNAFLRQNSNVVWFEFPRSSVDNTVYYYTVATSPGVPGHGTPYVANGYPQGGILTATGTIEIA